jgi:hypothetical protein
MCVESELKLNTVLEQFESLTYPLERDAAAESFENSTLLMADGETNLGTLIGETLTPTFDSPEDLFIELQTVLPIEAVGEPGQSDGDA